MIFLTARDALADRLAGFSAGGDDYLTKPFRFAELVARLRALLRRSGADPATTVGGLRLDPVTHAITGDGRGVAHADRVPRPRDTGRGSGAIVRRRDLVRAAWPEGAVVQDNTLDQYVARIRRKLYEVSAHAAIETAHGVGYRLG